MARQLRKRAAPPAQQAYPLVPEQQARYEADLALELFEQEAGAIVEREMAEQLQSLFAALLAVGPDLADQLAAETSQQRIATAVTGRILAAMQRYSTGLGHDGAASPD